MLHSVSVGKPGGHPHWSALYVIAIPIPPITVTTMTPTGSERVQSAFGKRCSARLLTLCDCPDALNRFLNEIDPKLVLIMETELPAKSDCCAAQTSYSFRLSLMRGFPPAQPRVMRSLASLSVRSLRRITLIAAQNEEDGERFAALGAKNNHQVTVTGSLKFDISVTPQLAAKAVTLRRQWAPHRPVWIATSTHDGEESIVIAAHRVITSIPEFITDSGARHPERFPMLSILCVRQAKRITASGVAPSASTCVGSIPWAN